MEAFVQAVARAQFPEVIIPAKHPEPERTAIAPRMEETMEAMGVIAEKKDEPAFAKALRIAGNEGTDERMNPLTLALQATEADPEAIPAD